MENKYTYTIETKAEMNMRRILLKAGCFLKEVGTECGNTRGEIDPWIAVILRLWGWLVFSSLIRLSSLCISQIVFPFRPRHICITVDEFLGWQLDHVTPGSFVMDCLYLQRTDDPLSSVLSQGRSEEFLQHSLHYHFLLSCLLRDNLLPLPMVRWMEEVSDG